MTYIKYRKGVARDVFTGEKQLSLPRMKKRKLSQRSAAISPEEQLQIDIIKYLRLVCPHCVVFHIPNEGQRSIARHMLMIEMGLYPGIADLCLLAPVTANGQMFWRSHFMEVKTLSGRLGSNQIDFKMTCLKLSIPWACVRGLDNVRDALLHWGIETREHAIIGEKVNVSGVLSRKVD